MIAFTGPDVDATLLRLISVLHRRRATLHHLVFARPQQGSSTLCATVEPVNAGVATVQRSVSAVVGVTQVLVTPIVEDRVPGRVVS
jgi:hypothetical protein